MATKTFKIGLSNTDKQAMAQETYERVLALTFPEYDSAEEYNVGDFVIYNDQLYKCIGATTGEWDSTKWQLATFNDLVEDIEGAVAFVNNKANVDGNYPTMTVGEADNLTPYDEEAGAEQNKPFFFQATGTANGSDPDFVTGSAALMKEKRGNTVVVNQQVKDSVRNYNFEFRGAIQEVDYYYSNIGSFELFNAPIENHKYLLFASVKNATQGFLRFTLFYGGYGNVVYIANNETKTLIVTASSSTDCLLRGISDNNTTDVSAHLEWFIIDLTQWFNGDIPQDLLDHPDHFFRYYQGSLAYNEGTLVNANGRYIKCIGRQQWDEEWEVGNIDSDGQNEADSTRIRSKNYIRVVPGLSYYAKCPSAAYLNVFFYDEDKNFVGALSNSIHNTSFNVPSNACYIRFGTYLYGATYNNDITISIYYDYESGYDGYYAYEELTNNDTGTEVLRSAGSVADIKLPSGEIKRNVGTYTFTGSESWEQRTVSGQYDSYRIINLLPAELNSKENLTGSIVCSNGYYGNANNGNGVYEGTDLGIGLDGRTVYVTVPSGANPNTIFAQGVIAHIELATPTTEQGTQYSENLVIDDFGSMDFGGTSGVPQGNAIFYPVDYKAYLDTLHKYTEGDPDNLALKTDLPTAPNTYLTSLTGYDATKTQVLKNVEGTLTWVTEGE